MSEPSHGAFAVLAALPSRPILGPAIHGHYAHLPGMTVGEVLLDAGTDVPMHTHPHDQVTYVIEGRFEFTVGGETTILEPGTVALIPGGTTHGGKTLSACRVIDVFAPARADYR